MCMGGQGSNCGECVWEGKVQNVGSVYGKVRFRLWGVCMGR